MSERQYFVYIQHNDLSDVAELVVGVARDDNGNERILWSAAADDVPEDVEPILEGIVAAINKDVVAAPTGAREPDPKIEWRMLSANAPSARLLFVNDEQWGGVWPARGLWIGQIDEMGGWEPRVGRWPSRKEAQAALETCVLAATRAAPSQEGDDG